LHISGNPLFIDGNKRTAFLCAKAILNINDPGLEIGNKRIVEVGLAVASGSLNTEELIVAVQNLIIETSE
jgi:prophage maintenance system killer protein